MARVARLRREGSKRDGGGLSDTALHEGTCSAEHERRGNGDGYGDCGREIPPPLHLAVGLEFAQDADYAGAVRQVLEQKIPVFVHPGFARPIDGSAFFEGTGRFAAREGDAGVGIRRGGNATWHLRPRLQAEFGLVGGDVCVGPAFFMQHDPAGSGEGDVTIFRNLQRGIAVVFDEGVILDVQKTRHRRCGGSRRPGAVRQKDPHVRGLKLCAECEQQECGPAQEHVFRPPACHPQCAEAGRRVWPDFRRGLRRAGCDGLRGPRRAKVR